MKIPMVLYSDDKEIIRVLAYTGDTVTLQQFDVDGLHELTLSHDDVRTLFRLVAEVPHGPTAV